MGGYLRCAVCGGLEDEGYPVSFEIDHIWQVEDGGLEDDERNTMPLCADCHHLKNIVRALRLHARGRSARDGCAADIRPGRLSPEMR
jgi:HNH endonuclease